MRTLIGITLITLAAATGACAVKTEAPTGDLEPAPVAPSTRERLETGAVSLRAVPAESAVTVAVRLPQEEATASPAILEARSGEVELTATPQGLVLERLRLSLEDGVVSPERLPPHGLTVTDVRLETAGPADAPVRWFGDGDEGWAELEADLLLDWKLIPPGHPERDPWPLAQQRLEDVVFDVHVTTDRHGNLVAEITGSSDGTFWSWGELAEMSDAQIQVVAIETGEGNTEVDR